jgi:hypothetical protein
VAGQTEDRGARHPFEQPNVAIISYDEKPGIQAISGTAPDMPPQPGFHAGWARDHEYKCLLTGKVHACVENCHRSWEFVGFLKPVLSTVDSRLRDGPSTGVRSTTQPT